MTDHEPYAVVDTNELVGISPGTAGCNHVDCIPHGRIAPCCYCGTHPVLGRFATEDDASAFIETLPDYLTGRYGINFWRRNAQKAHGTGEAG